MILLAFINGLLRLIEMLCFGMAEIPDAVDSLPRIVRLNTKTPLTIYG